MAKAADKNVIMISIHPEFAQAIFRGEKKVEFRKLNIPKQIKHVVLYVTAPEKKIVGYFSVKDIVEDAATKLWNRFQDVAGTTEEFFFNYYGRDGVGRGLCIGKVDILQHPISLDQIRTSSKPPQSFEYVDRALWLSLKRRKKVLLFEVIK